jgi:hypothetical protein
MQNICIEWSNTEEYGKLQALKLINREGKLNYIYENTLNCVFILMAKNGSAHLYLQRRVKTSLFGLLKFKPFLHKIDVKSNEIVLEVGNTKSYSAIVVRALVSLPLFISAKMAQMVTIIVCCETSVLPCILKCISTKRFKLSAYWKHRTETIDHWVLLGTRLQLKREPTVLPSNTWDAYKLQLQCCDRTSNTISLWSTII